MSGSFGDGVVICEVLNYPRFPAEVVNFVFFSFWLI